MSDSINVSVAQLERSMIDLAVGSWRFSRLFLRVVDKLDASEAKRYGSQSRYFAKTIEDSLSANELKLVNVEGLPFDPGMPVTALNAADFGVDDELVVDQMIEPIVMGAEGLKRVGTVMLRRTGA
jgi:hypothetical protein